ncbi:uncharacterized protein LOC124451964 [Xenia sp. Carnegie-2017]|uniref:uncharacterized protein LOC124451964 n=1 Tax=Xenia sp. Carnegie-2017 TaxID=2897299 RepID=UPI001F04B2C7|nr:uncharacterized protein LOC124451964 [Xenia sp. Carnegie-2017]
MYQFRKKFKRSNDFFYNNVERKGNTQKDDANEQSEDIAENYDKHQELTTKTQDSEDIFTKQSISIITEESKQPCQHSQSHLSPTSHYTGLLLQFDFASNISRQQSFVVHDYNANKRTIMHNSFVFVHRYPHLLLDFYGWILCCSCDANRKQFVEALPNNIQLDPQKQSTSMMQSVFSDHSYHEMQPEEAMRMMQAILLIFLKKMVIILAPSESGICSCGAEWDKRSIQDEWLYVDVCSVAYFYSIHDVKVYCRPCSSCATKKHYDGIENRIVWFGSYAISHAVLKITFGFS